MHKEGYPVRKGLLFLVIMLLILTCAAFAEEPEWVYSNNQGGIGRYNGAGGDVAVPETAEDHDVRTLGDGIFLNSETLVSLTLPPCVRSIGSSCLKNCPNLEQVTLTEGLQSIEYNNFMSLPKLEELTFPASVAVIDYSVNWCENLRKVTFLGECPVFTHPDFCFSVLAEDLTVYVPEDQVEAYRAALVNLRPEQIVSSGVLAVTCDYMPAAEELSFENGVITGYSGSSLRVDLPSEIGGTPVTAIGKYAFENSRLVCINIPEGVAEIGSMAFEGSSDLSVIRLPDSLKRIGSYAFDGADCAGITWGSGLEEIGEGAFRYTDLGAQLDLPAGLQDIGEEAFYRASLRDVHIGSGIRSIGPGAFSDTNLNYLELDVYDMIEVGENAFDSTRLEDIDLPWDSTQENQRAWQTLIDGQVEGCKVWINNPGDCDLPENGSCTYEAYPDGTLYVAAYTGTQESLVLYHTMDGVQVTGIGDGAFKGNQTLKKYRVTHNDTFTTIGTEAFAGSALEMLDLYYTVETIGAGAFRDCKNLTAVTLPASLREVGAGVFSGCENLTDVTILCDPAILPEDAFAGTAYLAAQATEAPAVTEAPAAPKTSAPAPAAAFITMPFAPSPEGDFAFNAETGTITDYYGSDVDVVIPREIGGVPVRAIDFNAFDRARDYTDTDVYSNRTEWLHLRSVVIPETVETIADSAFSYCQQLELFVCYAPLKTTGRGVFQLCRSLKNVVFVNGVEDIDNYCFDSCESLEKVYWGDHLERIGVNAFVKAGVTELTVDAKLVDEGAFWSSKLERVTLTDRVEKIRSGAFYMCEGLNYIAAQFSDAERFVDGGPFGGVPQTGVTTLFPAATTEEQMKALKSRWNVWNGGHLGSGNEITLQDVTADISALPDVEALYQQVGAGQSAGIAAWTPKATEAPVPPAFEGDQSMIPGVWKLRALMEEGQEHSASAFGMDMSLILNEDGTGMIIGEHAKEVSWELTDGVLYIGDGTDLIPAVLEEGKLVLTEDGLQLIFVNQDVEEQAVPATAEDVAPYVGEWHCIWVDTVVMSYNPEKDGIDEPTSLVIYPDGTAYFEDYDRTVGLIKQSGILYFEDLGIMPIEDGRFLCANDSMYFSRDRNDEVPDQYRHAMRDEIEALLTTPVSASVPSDPAQQVPGEMQMDVKYLATSYEAAGYSFDAAMLGAEYAVTFHADGSCAFVLAGYEVPGVTWGMDGDSIRINYDVGYPCTMNGDALELDFAGAMLLHMEPQE